MSTFFRVVALLCAATLLLSACTDEPEVAPDPRPVATPEPEEPEPEPEPEPSGEPFDVVHHPAAGHSTDNGMLYGREQVQLDPDAVEEAVHAARAAVENYLETAWIDPATRFSSTAVLDLLTPEAAELLDEDAEAALGNLDVSALTVTADEAWTNTIVIGAADRIDAVTVSWAAIAELDDGDETARLRSDGAATFVPGEGPPRAMAAEAITTVSSVNDQPDDADNADDAEGDDGDDAEAEEGDEADEAEEGDEAEGDEADEDDSVLAHARGRVRVSWRGEGDGPLTLLLLGSDVGPPHRPGDPARGRSDGIQVVAVDPETKHSTIVSVPRDTNVGGGKINRFQALQGPEAMRNQMAAWSGIEFDHWITTSFLGVIQLTDAIGGVPIVVERPMRDRNAGTNFDAGEHFVNGIAALAFMRDRGSLPDGDFGRAANQARFLAFAANAVLGEGPSLPQLTQLSADISRTTISDIPPEDMLPLVLLASELDPAGIRLQPLTGGLGTTSGGASIVNLNVGDAFQRIIDGQVGP